MGRPPSTSSIATGSTSASWRSISLSAGFHPVLRRGTIRTKQYQQLRQSAGTIPSMTAPPKTKCRQALSRPTVSRLLSCPISHCAHRKRQRDKVEQKDRDHESGVLEAWLRDQCNQSDMSPAKHDHGSPKPRSTSEPPIGNTKR